MNEKLKYNLYTTVLNSVFYLASIPLFKYFIQPQSDIFSQSLKFFISAIAFAIILQILLFRKLRRMSLTDINLIKADKKALDEFYYAFGAMPLKSLILCLGIILIFLFSIFFVGIKSLFIPVPEMIVFSGILLGYGFLTAGFIYVLLDRFVLFKLHSSELDYFPLTKKLTRLKAKMLIIPSFVSLMTFCISIFTSINRLFSVNTMELFNDMSMIRHVIFQSFIPLFSFFIITICLVILWSKNSSKQYEQITDRLENMTSGEKDLSKRIYISSVDELATINRYVNVFTDLITNHLGETIEVYNELDENQSILNDNVHDSLERISSISEILGDMTGSIESVDSIVNDSVSTGKNLVSNVAKTVEMVEQQSESISESSAAIEEMVASITEVSKRTDNVKDNSEKLAESVILSEKELTETISSISEVSSLSNNLMSINNLISGIAAQTNLLAMNAAIEAAHAGDSGRGFAVVADEIRKLAEDTSQHLKSSSESIKDITSRIQVSLGSAQQTGNAFSGMKEAFMKIHDESVLIAGSMTEHDRTNREVLTQLSTTREIASDLNVIAQNLSEQGNGLLKDFEKLESDSKNNLDNSSQIKTMNEQMKESFQKLSEAALITSDLYKKTKEMMNQFKL